MRCKKLNRVADRNSQSLFEKLFESITKERWIRENVVSGQSKLSEFIKLTETVFEKELMLILPKNSTHSDSEFCCTTSSISS